MAQNRLTKPQIAILRAAAEGNVYRSESIRDLYESYDRSDGKRRVTTIVDRLTERTEPLLRIGKSDGFTRLWLVTEAGRSELAKRETASRE